MSAHVNLLQHRARHANFATAAGCSRTNLSSTQALVTFATEATLILCHFPFGGTSPCLCYFRSECARTRARREETENQASFDFSEAGGSFHTPVTQECSAPESRMGWWSQQRSAALLCIVNQLGKSQSAAQIPPCTEQHQHLQFAHACKT